METLQAASHTKGAVSSQFTWDLELMRRWQKCFIFSLLLALSQKEEAIHTGKQTPPCTGRRLLSPLVHGGWPPSERGRGSPVSEDCSRRSLGEKDAGRTSRKPSASPFLLPRQRGNSAMCVNVSCYLPFHWLWGSEMQTISILAYKPGILYYQGNSRKLDALVWFPQHPALKSCILNHTSHCTLSPFSSPGNPACAQKGRRTRDEKGWRC